MKEIPKKNYCLLVVLLAVTVVLTLSLSSIYLNKEKLVSNFYEYSNKITVEEFDEYMIENSDTIIYISDKYDLTLGDFEKKLQNKLDEKNWKQNFVFLDKKDINDKFLNKLKNTYKINIDLEKTPIIIVVVDKRVIKNVKVTSSSDVNTLIDYEVFEWLM